MLKQKPVLPMLFSLFFIDDGPDKKDNRGQAYQEDYNRNRDQDNALSHAQCGEVDIEVYRGSDDDYCYHSQ
jgi:hypothetical protein